MVFVIPPTVVSDIMARYFLPVPTHTIVGAQQILTLAIGPVTGPNSNFLTYHQLGLVRTQDTPGLP